MYFFIVNAFHLFVGPLPRAKQQLELLGFSPLVMVGQDKLDVISLVNATHGLLHQVNEYERNKKQTEDRSHQVISDLHHCQVRLFNSFFLLYPQMNFG